MFQLIAGPCVIESEEMVLSIAGEMKRITEELGIPYPLKGLPPLPISEAVKAKEYILSGIKKVR